MNRPTMHTIPFFPLPLALLPGEVMPLHIFEPKYLQMVNTCLQASQVGLPHRIGIVFVNRGTTSVVGCAATIVKVAEIYEDGRKDIFVRGTERFKLHREQPEGPFPQVEISYIDEEGETVEPAVRAKAIALQRKLEELREGAKPIREIDKTVPLSFALAVTSSLDMSQKQQLLEMQSENQRLLVLVEFYRRVIAEISEAVEIKRRISSNGHYPKF